MTAKLTKRYTVSVYIFTDAAPRQALLLHHRKFNKWLPPGGHVEAWENPAEAAIREVQEETGLDIAPLLVSGPRMDDDTTYLPTPTYVLEAKIPAHGGQPEYYHIDLQYVVRMPRQVVTHRAEESHAIGWFGQDESEELPTFEDVRRVLRQELKP